MEWPAELLPSSCTLKLKSNSSAFTSPLSGATQTVAYPGSKWVMELTFNDQDQDEIDMLNVIIAQLNGRAGRIYLWDFSKPGSQPLGSPVIKESYNSSLRISTKGWQPNKTVLKRGSWISINNRMTLVVNNVVSNAQGEALIDVSPPLIVRPTAGQKIETLMPKSKFMLQEDENGGSREPGITGSFSLSFIEDIN